MLPTNNSFQLLGGFLFFYEQIAPYPRQISVSVTESFYKRITFLSSTSFLGVRGNTNNQNRITTLYF